MTLSPLFKEPPSDAIQQLVRDAFGSGTRLVSSEPLLGGAFNTTYKVVVDNYPSPVVLRIAPEHHHRLYSFERSLILREWRINKLLLSKGVRVPQALYCHSATSQLDRAHSFWEFLPGRTLEEAQPSDSQLATIRHQLECELKKINRTSSSWFGWVGQTESRHTSWTDFLLSIVDEIAHRNKDWTVLPYACIEQTKSVLRSAKAEGVGTESPPVFVHNDLHAGNLIVDRDTNLVGLIDADRSIFAPADFELGLSEIAQDDSVSGGVDIAPAADSLATRVYRIVLNMFDADVCATQLGRRDTSELLVDCVVDDLASL